MRCPRAFSLSITVMTADIGSTWIWTQAGCWICSLQWTTLKLRGTSQVFIYRTEQSNRTLREQDTECYKQTDLNLTLCVFEYKGSLPRLCTQPISNHSLACWCRYHSHLWIHRGLAVGTLVSDCNSLLSTHYWPHNLLKKIPVYHCHHGHWLYIYI